uniref:Transposase n=1 Tax=Ascaris lumbricoides TaxID=6252 RepID=A0A0M3HTQ8_ASCLU
MPARPASKDRRFHEGRRHRSCKLDEMPYDKRHPAFVLCEEVVILAAWIAHYRGADSSIRRITVGNRGYLSWKQVRLEMK